MDFALLGGAVPTCTFYTLRSQCDEENCVSKQQQHAVALVCVPTKSKHAMICRPSFQLPPIQLSSQPFPVQISHFPRKTQMLTHSRFLFTPGTKIRTFQVHCNVAKNAFLLWAWLHLHFLLRGICILPVLFARHHLHPLPLYFRWFSVKCRALQCACFKCNALLCNFSCIYLADLFPVLQLLLHMKPIFWCDRFITFPTWCARRLKDICVFHSKASLRYFFCQWAK